jgi:hypothetical protein
MKVPTLENNRVKLSLLDLSNYNQLSAIAQEPYLIQYSPSDISTQEKLKGYVQTGDRRFLPKNQYSLYYL